MKFLLAAHSPLLKLDERNKSARLNYKQWQQIVANNINDIFEYQRITNEVDEIEKNIEKLEDLLSTTKQELDAEKGAEADLNTEVDDLRELMESSNKYSRTSVSGSLICLLRLGSFLPPSFGSLIS